MNDDRSQPAEPAGLKKILSGRPRIGLGLAALGRPGYLNLDHGRDLPADKSVDGMRRHCHALLDQAWDAGLRYFDTARSYGLGESFLGSWLQNCGHSGGGQPVIASKWGYTYTADWRIDAEVHEVKEHSLKVLQRQWRETQNALGAPHLYQIHSATLESGVLDNGSVLTYLAGLREQGVAIGLTTSGPGQSRTLDRALQVEIDGRPLFSAVQATLNLLERSAAKVLQAAHRAGLLVILKEGLANGRLAGRPTAPVPPLLVEFAEAHQVGVDAVALAALLAYPWVDVVLSGAATAAQLNSNLSALNLELSPDELQRLSVLEESPEAYWRTRGRLVWN